MIIGLLVFLAGVLTILSPCVLPVLPFVFARAERSFIKNGLPLLLGMALSFAGIATLAAVGGAWAVRLNQYGRWFALILLTVFALSLLSRRLADLMAYPFVQLGNALMSRGANNANDINGTHDDSSQSGGIFQSVLLGLATGLLWAPCAGPILGLVLTGAALSGPSTQTTLLLFLYAAGAATSMAVALLAGGRVFARLKRSLGAGEWVRRGLGVAVLLGVLTIAMGWDTRILTQLSASSTNRLEQALLERVRPHATLPTVLAGGAASSTGVDESTALPDEGVMPSLSGAVSWLNSEPLDASALRGKVVLIDFWTYSCINCLRTLPYVRAWEERYRANGLVVIGVHSPEFAFEKDEANVRAATKRLGVSYPVALDNNFQIWRAFNNRYWPAHYFIDAKGHIRGHHFGEGNYVESEQLLRRLLIDAGARDLPPPVSSSVSTAGVHIAAAAVRPNTPETYLGYARARNFASTPAAIKDENQTYRLPAKLALNQWGLNGLWRIDSEKATLRGQPGRIDLRFQARDVNLVLGTQSPGKALRFRVMIDGVAPGANHGMDVDTEGWGTIREQRLYQLLRQREGTQEHTITIEFSDVGAEAFAFTFG